MRKATPWGLAYEAGWLESAKVISDPVHNDIYVNKLELAIIDTPTFQRLGRVRQLGLTPRVYPGATNTRFAHSLGTLRVAQDLLDIILGQRHDPHGVTPDLFGVWEDEADEKDELPRQLGEVIVAARLGALLHDIAHIPFGHSIEDDLGLLTSHDEGIDRFKHLWQAMARELRAAHPAQAGALEPFLDGKLADELRPVILSKEKGADGKKLPAQERMTYPFVADLVGDTICADLIDYLQRDHLYSGLPMELGHRFLDAFFVTPPSRARKARRMALSITRESRERTDVITELLKYLRYRYELTERVLVHHAKLGGDAMVGKALELWHDELRADVEAELAEQGTTDGAEATPAGEDGEDGEESEDGEAESGSTATGENTAEASGPGPQALSSGTGSGDRAVAVVATDADPLDEVAGDTPKGRASKRMERRILRHGDDGLLEFLRDWALDRSRNPPAHADADRVAALGQLVQGLIDRKLFYGAGRSSTQQASAQDIYNAYRKPEQRRELEQAAATFAGIDQAWKLCIWLPPPSPRLKSAEVLVYDGTEIVEFNRSEHYKAGRGEDIYDAHQRLWAVSVYAHPSVPAEQARWAAVYLAQTMEVRWDKEVGPLGADPADWPDNLAALEVVPELEEHVEPLELVRRVREQKVARGKVTTAEELKEIYRQVGGASSEV